MRITIVALAALMTIVASSAVAGEGGVEDIYSQDWIGKSYGLDGLPVVSAAYDSLPGSHSVYGQLRVAATHSWLDGGKGDRRRSLSQDNEASILGVRGWVGNDKVKAIYNAQFGLNFDNAAVLGRRFAWLGFTHHKIGKVIVGTTSTSYKLPGLRIDPFYNTPAGQVNAVANYGLSRFTNGFVNNTIAYTTPTRGGFALNGSIYIDDSAEDDHGANGGISWTHEGFTAGGQYLHATEGSGLVAGRNVNMARGHAKMKGDGWSLGATYEHEFNHAMPDVNYIYVAGTFDPCENWTLAGSVGFETDGADEGVGGTVGAFYEVLKGVYLYGLVSHVEIDDETISNPSRTVASVGLNLAFSVGDK